MTTEQKNNQGTEISNGTRIFIFGNPNVEIDSLPVKLLPRLKQVFPEHTFTILDPNEEWEVPQHMNIIDTIVGIDTITIFDSLDVFMQTPKMTCHDFDAYTNLLFLKKLGRITSVRILGIPPQTEEETVLKALKEFLEK